MKNICRNTFFLLFLILACFQVDAQISNLTVNGVTANFTANEGAGTKWEYNLPIGGTATIEIWVDINANGTIEPTIDKSIFGSFHQIDGDMSGDDGPPDMDGAVNGHCLFDLPHFNIAPARYVITFSNNGTAASISGIVNPLLNPTYTVTGRINTPVGISAQNFLIRAEDEMTGWMTLVDASGNYTLRMDASANGVTYRIFVNDEVSPYSISPSEIELTITQSFTNINFSYVQPVAKIVGYVRGEDGHIFQNTRVSTWPNYGGRGREVNTDASGFYQLGFSASDLSNSTLWGIGVTEDIQPMYMSPHFDQISLHAGDSLRIDLKAYLTNDSISGRVYIDGKVPTVAFRIYAGSTDSGHANCLSNPITGEFKFYVSKKVRNFYLGFHDLPDSLTYNWGQNQASPGMHNVIMHIASVAWRQQNKATQNDLTEIYFHDQNLGWAVGNNGTVLRTTNGGSDWGQASTNTTLNINALSFVSPQTGWIAGDNGVIKKSTDGGSSWVSQNSVTNYNLSGLKFFDENIGFSWGTNGMGQCQLLKTTNGGNNWMVIYNTNNFYLTVCMLNANVGYLNSSGMVFKTVNGGSTWSETGLMGGQATMLKFVNENTGWAVGNGNMVFSTTNGGVNWNTSNVETGMLYGLFCSSQSTLYVVGDSKAIFRSTNGGSTWVRQTVSNNDWYLLRSVHFVDQNNGWAAGSSGTILHTNNGGILGVSDKNIAANEKSLSLYQNYPNPFNPTTRIQFYVPERQTIAVKIYDVLGREIAKLFDGQMEAGEHILQFNAINISSGVYFYQIDNGAVKITKKMILIR